MNNSMELNKCLVANLYVIKAKNRKFLLLLSFCEKIATIAAIFTSSTKVSAALLVLGALAWHTLGWIAGAILLTQVMHKVLSSRIFEIIIRFIATPFSIILDILGYFIAKSINKTCYYKPLTQQIWTQSLSRKQHKVEMEELAYMMRTTTRALSKKECSGNLDIYIPNWYSRINKIL